MNAQLKHRTISEIIESRKEQRVRKNQRIRTLVPMVGLSEPPNEVKIESLLRKTTFSSEDKVWLMRYIEKKYRIYFDHSFSISQVNWIITKEKKIINKHYDTSLKSYYLLKGKLSVCEKAMSLRESYRSHDSQNTAKYEEIAAYEGEVGIGKLFSHESHSKCVLLGQNTLILQFEHQNGEIDLIERNCLMTSEEKEHFIKQLSLFKELDNINKYYTPFFTARRYNKGDLIYKMDDQSTFLYLIVQGEIEFETQIEIENPQTVENGSLRDLTLKNSRKNYIVITTETLSNSNFFGEEEIINNSNRKQNARCLSLTCLILQISVDKVHKLMYYNEFKEALDVSYVNKQFERSKKIANFLSLRQSKKETIMTERHYDSIDFNEFNEGIYNSRTDRKEESLTRLALKDHKLKIVHGNPIKTNKCSSQIKPEKFSMLQVNQAMYESAMKKFKSFSMEQKKRQNKQSNQQTIDPNAERKGGRSIKKIWKVLKLESVLQQQKFQLTDQDGRKYFNAHMRLVKHLKDVKSYRPKTIASNCRVKTEYVEYLHHVL